MYFDILLHKKFGIRTYPMFKKTQVTILIATLTMQVQSMENAKPTDVIFDGRRTTNNSFFNFYQSKKSFKKEYRIDKICLRKNIPANSVVNLIIPARTKDGRQVVLDKKACAGWNNPNIKIYLYFVATKILEQNKRKGKNKGKAHYQKVFASVKIVGDKTEFFQNSTSLIHVDMSGADNEPAKCDKDTKKNNVNIMTSMFDGCLNLESIKWGKFNISKATRVDYMFRNCWKLSNLNRLYISRARTAKGMCANCYNLKRLTLSGGRFAKLKNMEEMFLNCVALNNLDLSRLKFSRSAKMNDFISGCQSLEELSIHPAIPRKRIDAAIAFCTNCPQFIDEEGFLINR